MRLEFFHLLDQKYFLLIERLRLKNSSFCYLISWWIVHLNNWHDMDANAFPKRERLSVSFCIVRGKLTLFRVESNFPLLLLHIISSEYIGRDKYTSIKINYGPTSKQFSAKNTVSDDNFSIRACWSADWWNRGWATLTVNLLN